MGVLEKLGWKPPSSKQSGITDADTLFSDKTIQHVEKYYNDKKCEKLVKLSLA